MTATDRQYFVRTSLIVWIALPILAQIAAFLGMLLTSIALDAFGAYRSAVYWLSLTLSACLIFMIGAIASWHLQKVKAPANFFLRYGPLLIPLLLMWLVWIIDMHVRGGDFTKQGADLLLLVFLPYIALAVVAAFVGLQWFILLVPSIALAGFAFFTWRKLRSQALPTDMPMLASVGLLVCCATVMAWQASRQQSQVVNWLDGTEVFRENLDIWQYRPFKSDNKLIAVDVPASLRTTQAEAPRLDGATAAYPVYAALAQAMYAPEWIDQKLANSKTPKAYERLIKGETDAIFVAQASPEHERMAKERGVQLIMTPIAREAFVFLVHRDNPVKSLTTEQLRDVYAGKLSQWKEVGGTNQKIIAYQRPKNSGSQTVMEAKVMQGLAMRQPLEEVQQGMGGLVRQVASYRNDSKALGYSFRYYATQMQDPKHLHLLSVNGVAPTVDTIRSAAYPLSVDVFMVTTQHSQARTKNLRDWLLSAEGQRFISKAGYVPR